MTMNISAYSLVAVTRRAAEVMPAVAEDGSGAKVGGGSILTLTYYGAEKVIPHYNVLGVAKAALETSVKYLANDLGPRNIRVNTIRAGPNKTRHASGIADLDRQGVYEGKSVYIRVGICGHQNTQKQKKQ